MSQSELVKSVIAFLQDAGIEYMITGSLASSLQGTPRATHDVDLIVSLSFKDVPKLLQAFPPPDFYLSQQAIEGAIQNKSMFNLISFPEGDKADFWILQDEPFNQSRFSRKRTMNFEGVPLQVSSPEDTILAKMRWSELMGGSEKQFMDILGVYELQYSKLDMDYLNHWVKQLGLESLWQRLQLEAKVS